MINDLNAAELLNIVNLKVDEVARKYLYFIPSQLMDKKNYPLLIVLHGGGGSADQIARKLDFKELAEKNKFIVMYPDAFEEHWNDLRGDSKSGSSIKKIDDVKYIEMVVADLKQKLKLLGIEIDPNRIYGTGLSNGGMMLHTLGIKSDLIKKIVPVIANLPQALEQTHSIGHPDILIINGNEDTIMPFSGGLLFSDRGKVSSVAATLSYWLKQNNCNYNLPLKIFDNLKNEKSILSRCDQITEEWSCAGKKQVKLIILYKAGHTWPGKTGHFQKIAGEPCLNVKGEDLVVKFLGL